MSSSDEGDGWENDRAVIPIDDLLLAVEREGFLTKSNNLSKIEHNESSVSYGDGARNDCLLADSIVHEILETLDETSIDEVENAGKYCGDLPEITPSASLECDGNGKERFVAAASSDFTNHDLQFDVNIPSTSAVSPGSRPNSVDHKLQDSDDDSDASDLLVVPELESAALQAVLEGKPSVVEVVVPPRQRMSRGQSKMDSRQVSKKKREKGEGYLGFRRRETDKGLKTVAHDTPRNAKEMGPPCNSEKCKQWSTRFCSSISEGERAKLFSLFWKGMSWDTKKMFICNMVDIKPKKVEQTTGSGGKSRRSMTLLYHLKIGERKFQVCKRMFLNTFGLGEMSVRYWLGNFHGHSVPHQKNLAIQDQKQSETLSEDETPKPSRQRSAKQTSYLVGEMYLKEYLNAMPKLPSHYIRKDSRKLYLEADIKSVSQLYRLFKEKCAEDNKPCVSRYSFDKVYKAMNIGIFNPRKDQCDVCCGFKTGNVSADVHARHITLKEQARKEKECDKERAIAGEVHVITCDMMAVQVMPRLLASSSYYKLKLHVHNYTIFNLGNRDVKCYWWDETVGSLDATVYASCLVDYIEELMKTSPKKDVIVYSDGCTAQNRNSILSNALLHTSMKHNITIKQKILEKGHTQMEVDSVHGHIEGKMGKSEMYLPHHFIQKTTEARIKDDTPYRAVYLNHDFFLDYGVEDKMIYSSIRPGNAKGDPVVMDLRWIQYEPHGEIKFKLKYDDELQSLPRRPRVKHDHNFLKLYKKLRPLTFDQYKDLLYLAENLLPKDCLLYYKGLPHEGTSIRAERKKGEAVQKKNVKKSEENIKLKEMVPKKRVNNSEGNRGAEETIPKKKVKKSQENKEEEEQGPKKKVKKGSK